MAGVFFITARQAIDVWVHLEQAYQGQHGYGSTTAEVYCYLLQARSPGVDFRVPEPGDIGHDAFVARAMETARAFHWIFLRFLEAHPDAQLEIDGRSFREWERIQLPKGEDHRLHITVTKSEGN